MALDESLALAGTVTGFTVNVAPVSVFQGISLTASTIGYSGVCAKADPPLLLSGTTSGDSDVQPVAITNYIVIDGRMRGDSQVAAAAAVEVNVNGRGTGTSDVEAEADLLGDTDTAADKDLLIDSVGTVSSNLQVATTYTYSTVTDILDDAAKLTGYLSAADMIDSKQQTLVDKLNAALQLMYERSAWLDYFSQVTRDITVPSTGDTKGQVIMPDDVQSVDSYVRAKDGSRPLRECERMSDIERFAAVYLGPNDPQDIVHAYYANRSAAPASAYGFTTTLVFAPVPAEDTIVTINVTLNAPRFGWKDYLNHTQLSIPHRYTQAILSPLVRDQMTSSIDFACPEQLPAIQAQAAKARETLGLVDTKPSNRTPATESAANKS